MCVELPADVVLPRHSTENDLMRKLYGDIAMQSRHASRPVTPPATAAYFSARAILASYNDDVERLNSTLLRQLDGDAQEFLSVDKVDVDSVGAERLYPVDFLNTVTAGGLPPHRLLLKPGCVVMLLVNLRPADGLCNGTRMLVKRIYPHCIDCEVLIGEAAGHRESIPRVICVASDTDLP
eukprot:gene10813-11385_t